MAASLDCPQSGGRTFIGTWPNTEQVHTADVIEFALCSSFCQTQPLIAELRGWGQMALIDTSWGTQCTNQWAICAISGFNWLVQWLWWSTWLLASYQHIGQLVGGCDAITGQSHQLSDFAYLPLSGSSSTLRSARIITAIGDSHLNPQLQDISLPFRCRSQWPTDNNGIDAMLVSIINAVRLVSITPWAHRTGAHY